MRRRHNIDVAPHRKATAAAAGGGKVLMKMWRVDSKMGERMEERIMA